jgi:hypothetical protein
MATKWNPDIMLPIAEVLSRLHAENKDYAFAFGVTSRTFTNWYRDIPELRELVVAGRQEDNVTVAKSLFERANGYSHPEEKIFLDKDGDIVRAKTIKHYPPDTGAIAFFLKNRDPENWKDRHEVVVEDLTREKIIKEKMDKLEKTGALPTSITPPD